MFEVAIIGGGVIGANILNSLTRRGISCVLIEKNNDVGAEVTKANSGLIHAGFDCKPDTLKAKFNVGGNKLIERLAKELDIPYKQIGALVVGNDLRKLNELKDRGDQNGVKELSILNAEELHALEPNLSKDIKFGLWAKTAGIISPYLFTVALCEEAILNGAVVKRNFDVALVERKKDKSFVIYSRKNTKIEAKQIVNCCGASYNKVAELLNAEKYPVSFRRGEYYVLDNTCSNIVSHTIFPLPDENSKGVLVTPTIDGNILVGPTSTPSDTNPKTTEDGLNEISQKAQSLIVGLPLSKNIRVFAGVRTISGEDFVVEKSKLQTGIINIAGICSPGLSSSPAIAEYVVELLGYEKTPLLKKLIRRKNIVSLKNKSIEEQNKLIKQNPDYGKIVCKCEMVSLAEIKSALTSPLPALSVDAVKRRVRAGMGRCQGGFCLSKVIEEIAKIHKKPLTSVQKENIGSEILSCTIRPQRKVKNGK